MVGKEAVDRYVNIIVRTTFSKCCVLLLAVLALIVVHSTCTGLTCVGLSRTSLKCACASKRGGAFSTYYPYPLLYCL